MARTVALALLLLSLPGTMAQAAPDAKGDPTQRSRELIYSFRTYRVFSRDEEWARTIRELAAIGKDAVPELVAELDRTDRDATLRSLGFSLRAIGDPRAVPGLIRAIPKALRPPGSDCGLAIADPDLRAFMLTHQNHKPGRDSDSVASGRPVNEIISALERITGHREPPKVGDDDPLRHVFLGGTPEQQAQQRALFEERRKRWEAWWTEHSREFVTPEELRSVELPRRDEDLVEKAGLARYGALFPTGAAVRLGPVRMLRLGRSIYANARSHLDLDTGRVFSNYEGMKTADWGAPDEFSSRFFAWYRRNGIDVRCQGPAEGLDLQLWLIDNSRWDTLESEVRKDEPLPLGQEANSYLVRFETSRSDLRYNETATFLFTTREGGRGIIQVFPKDLDADRYRLRYRTWLTEQGPEATPPAAHPVAAPRSSGTSFAKAVTTTLERPAEGQAFLLDLDTGRKVVPPEDLKPAIANAATLSRNDRFLRWCREQGIDAFGYVAAVRVMGRGRALEPKPEAETRWRLIGLDMVEARIVPLTFDELTVEEAREILDRIPAQMSPTAYMTIDTQVAERPDTFAFRTREGATGLLQMEAAGKDAGLTLRYRLERRD